MDTPKLSKLIRTVFSAASDGEQVAALASLRRAMATEGLDLHDIFERHFAGMQRRAVDQPEIVLISPQQAAELTSLSVRQIGRLEEKGWFPRRAPLTKRRFGYAKHEVIAWNEARLAERQPRRRPAHPDAG